MADRLQPRADRIEIQNAYLSYHLVRRALDRAKVHVNGYLQQPKTPAALESNEGFKRVLKALEKANDVFMDRYRESVMTLVETLDISDSQLHTEFLRAAGQIVDEIRWGRIASLFFLTSLLAERLVREGQSAKIESLVTWLAHFLNDHVSPWIEQRGGWVSQVTQYRCVNNIRRESDE